MAEEVKLNVGETRDFVSPDSSVDYSDLHDVPLVDRIEKLEETVIDLQKSFLNLQQTFIDFLKKENERLLKETEMYPYRIKE